MSTQKRILSLDLVKAIAIVGVVLLHACGGAYGGKVGSFDWVAANIWGGISRAGVPLFFLCSGALLLSPDYELSLKKLYTRLLPRILFSLLFWALGCKVLNLALAGELTGDSFLTALADTLLFRHEFHLYFSQILLIVYAVLPVTRAFVRQASSKELWYAIGLWFVLGILFPSMQVYLPFRFFDGIPAQWLLNSTYAAIGYGLLGYAIRTLKKQPLGLWLGCIFAGFAGVFVPTLALSIWKDTLCEEFYSWTNVGLCLYAVGIFGLCLSLRLKKAGVATFLAKASLSIYLTHVLFMRLCAKVDLTIKILPALASIPVLALVLLACSCLTYILLSKIPFVKRWLI